MSKPRPNIKTWLGFDSRYGRLLAGSDLEYGRVPVGATVTVVTRPQVSFRGERLFVHQPVASSFLIHDLRLGTMAMLANGGHPIPADAFATRMDRLAAIDDVFEKDKVFDLKIDKLAADILGAEWALPLTMAATDYTLIIENVGSEPARFVAGLLGEEVERR